MLAYLFDPDEPELRARARAGARRPGAARPGRWSPSSRSSACPSPGSRSPGSPGTDPSAGRTSPPRSSSWASSTTVSDAFTPEWLADGGRAYVEKHELDPFDAIRLVKAAGGVTVFAHPLAVKRGACVPESAIAELAAAGLDGIEVDHMDHDEPTRARLRGLAAELGLLATGSSDYHGSRKTCRLGEYTTDPEIYGEIMRRATGAFPVPGAGGYPAAAGPPARPPGSSRLPVRDRRVRHPPRPSRPLTDPPVRRRDARPVPPLARPSPCSTSLSSVPSSSPSS